MVADQRHGIATSVLANVSRDAKRHPDPYRPTDFIPWSEVHQTFTADGSVLMVDAEQHSRLIKQALFKSK